MPRGSAKPAAAAPKPAAKAQKKYTTQAHDESARELAERRKLAHEAAAWAVENDVGSKMACKQEQFAGLSYNMVEPLRRKLKETGSIDLVRDHHRQILTNEERHQLAEWILACADGQDPNDRTQVSAKIKELLKACHASNKKKN
jgi:hypothetical protein